MLERDVTEREHADNAFVAVEDGETAELWGTVASAIQTTETGTACEENPPDAPTFP